MPGDKLNAGVDFASRLASNVYGLHKQEQDRDRLDQERQRQSMLTILESAANSGNVNPEDMPALYSKLFELNGAKAKDVAALTPHLQAAFTLPDTARTATFNHQSQVPGQTVGTGDFQTDLPAFDLPPVPTTETINSPAVRLMSPEEKAGRAAQSQLAAMQTTYPQRKRELDEASDRKLELQGAALDAKEKSKLAEITLKGGIDAQKKLNGYVATYKLAGYDDDTARGLAAKALIKEQDAVVAEREQRAATGRARAKYLEGSLAIHRKNADTLARRVDLYAKSLEETARFHRANESGAGKGSGAVGRNLKVLMANTKELYTALTPLNNAIVKLETDPLNKESDGTLIAEVATQVADLKARRDAIQTKLDTARQTWLPQMPEPTDSVVPAVPQQGSGAVQPKGIIRRGNLNGVRGQNPTLMLQHPEFVKDDNALIQYLQLHGYTVK